MGSVFAPTRYKLSVEDFHKLGDAGILTEDSRVELIDGELIEMAPIGSRHAWVVNRLSMLFARRLGEDFVVSTQNPVTLGQHSEPQPDLMLLRGKPGGYIDALPTPADVLLLVEVSDTSADHDRTVKLPTYARHGVCEVWIIDLHAKRVEVYREPTADSFSTQLQLGDGDVASPRALPQLVVDVGEIFR